MSDERIAELSAQIAAANDKPATEPSDDAKQPKADPDPQGEGEQDEGAAPSDDVERKPTGKKPGVHQRIDELTREKYEARREADELRKKLEQMEKGAKPATPEAPAPKQPDAKPTLEQFDFDVAKHEAALEKWVRQTAEREFEAKREKETREAETKRLSDAFTTRLQAFEKANPGAWEAATKAPINVTPPMMEVIATSDHGPEIGVYLANNLEEAERISKLTPIGQAAALGRIEASLSAPRQPEKQPSRAPAPPTTLGSPAPAKKEWAAMSTEEHIREWRAKQANR